MGGYLGQGRPGQAVVTCGQHFDTVSGQLIHVTGALMRLGLTQVTSRDERRTRCPHSKSSQLTARRVW